VSIAETPSLTQNADLNTVHSFVMRGVSALKHHRTKPCSRALRSQSSAQREPGCFKDETDSAQRRQIFL
jgi:hypothetical protein